MGWLRSLIAFGFVGLVMFGAVWLVTFADFPPFSWIDQGTTAVADTLNLLWPYVIALIAVAGAVSWLRWAFSREGRSAIVKGARSALGYDWRRSLPFLRGTFLVAAWLALAVGFGFALTVWEESRFWAGMALSSGVFWLLRVWRDYEVRRRERVAKSIEAMREQTGEYVTIASEERRER